MLSERAIRTRAAALEAKPIDNAAMTMAAEAVSSMEPIRSVFISHSYLFHHSFSINRVSASFFEKLFGSYQWPGLQTETR
jgi:hypothetical protein